jgi:hypothetical protein
MDKKQNNKRDFTPVYLPSQINEDILISEESVKVTTAAGECIGKCKIMITCLPQARLRFHVNFNKIDTSLFHGGRDSIKSVFLPERQLEIPGLAVNYNVSLGKKSEITMTWTPCKEPIIASGNKKSSMSYVVFNIFNFKDFRGTRNSVKNIKNGGTCRIDHINITWQGWEIEIKKLESTSQTVKELKAKGGYGLTHIGIIRKKNNIFTGEEVENILLGIGFLLSFARGIWCHPILSTGFNENECKVWEEWISPSNSWITPHTWFDEQHGQQLQDFFPGLMDKLTDDSWGDTIQEVIYWYLQSCNLANGTDSGIILIQAAIERLSFEYTVNHKKLLTKNGFKDLWASDKFRLLFASIDIPLDIPDSDLLIPMKVAAKNFNWLDAPHAFTEVRNSIIHPEHKKRDSVKKIYYETWSMGLWYLELAILRLCDYRGTYNNRLVRGMVGQVENVPWSKKNNKNNNFK